MELPDIEKVVIGNHIGQVKWFNHRLGYGFITYKKDEENTDIFVHHSSIKYKNQNLFKNLYPGEYVEFDVFQPLVNTQVQAENVVGVNGGLLMSEFRYNMMNNRKNRKKH